MGKKRRAGIPEDCAYCFRCDRVQALELFPKRVREKRKGHGGGYCLECTRAYLKERREVRATENRPAAPRKLTPKSAIRVLGDDRGVVTTEELMAGMGGGGFRGIAVGSHVKGWDEKLGMFVVALR